jgi:hypothetical protein
MMAPFISIDIELTVVAPQVCSRPNGTVLREGSERAQRGLEKTSYGIIFFYITIYRGK